MFYILYLMLFFKINLPYLKLSLIIFIKDNNQSIDVVIIDEFLSLQFKPIVIPFIHYNIYTFYEQG